MWVTIWYLTMNYLPCSANASALSYRRPVGAEVIEQGSYGKHPAYC